MEADLAAKDIKFNRENLKEDIYFQDIFAALDSAKFIKSIPSVSQLQIC